MAATVGLAIALTACSTDVRKLSCKDLNGNPGAVNAMAKVAITNPALAPYVNPTNKFGGGGSEAAGAGVDEGGLTNEFKSQVASLCAGASGSTQPYDTALGNTESFARTGARTPAPSSQSTGASNGGSGSDQGSGGSSGGSSAGGSSGSQPPAPQGSGSQPSGSSPSSSGSPPSGGSSSAGGSPSSGAGNGASGAGSSGSGGSSSSGNGNPNIPPCLPPSCAF